MIDILDKFKVAASEMMANASQMTTDNIIGLAACGVVALIIGKMAWDHGGRTSPKKPTESKPPFEGIKRVQL